MDDMSYTRRQNIVGAVPQPLVTRLRIATAKLAEAGVKLPGRALYPSHILTAALMHLLAQSEQDQERIVREALVEYSRLLEEDLKAGGSGNGGIKGVRTYEVQEKRIRHRKRKDDLSSPEYRPA